MVEYTIENGSLILTVDGDKDLIDKVGIMYDKQTDCLLKHGRAEKVEEYYNVYTTAISLISKEMTESAVMIKFDGIALNLLADFMNKIINCTGNISKHIENFLEEVKMKENDYV